MLPIQKQDLLLSIYIACIMVAESMGGKTFTLFHIGTWSLSASVAIFTLPIVFTINDVICEVFGKARARSLALSGICMVAGLAIFSLLAVALPPSSRFAATNPAYIKIFHASIRLSCASIIAFICAELLDVYIFAAIRKSLGQKRLWLRTNVSNILSQGVDTFIFMILAFWNLSQGFHENAVFLIGIILPYWFLKCVFSAVETPFVYLGVRWLKAEQPKEVCTSTSH